MSRLRSIEEMSLSRVHGEESAAERKPDWYTGIEELL